MKNKSDTTNKGFHAKFVCIVLMVLIGTLLVALFHYLNIHRHQPMSVESNQIASVNTPVQQPEISPQVEVSASPAETNVVTNAIKTITFRIQPQLGTEKTN